MKQILITKLNVDYGASTGATITTSDGINLLADGALACFESSGAIVDGASPSVSSPAIYFALGRTGKSRLITPLIDLATLKFTKLAYTAPAAKVIVVGSPTDGGTTYNINIPSSPTVGSIASVMLINQSKPHHDRTREKTYEYQVRLGDNAASVATAIVAKINADASKIATAAMVDTTNKDGFKLTAVTAGVDFSVVCGGIMINADVLGYNEVLNAGTAGITKGRISLTTPVVAQNPGQGTYAQILGMEEDYSTELGNNGVPSKEVNLFTLNSRAVVGETYVQYELTWTMPNDNPLIPKANMQQSLTIAVPSADTGTGKIITALDAILAAV